MFELTDFKKEGNEKLLEKGYFYLAIVGSRSILSYTEVVLDDLFEKISEYKNIVIVSGGMYGVDLYVHNLALKYDLGTIIFLPSGIDNYKSTNLYNSLKIKENSKILLASKYDYGFCPRRFSYLERNKHIVNFSNSVLIAQSSIKSGSIFSGNYALQVSKHITSIPFALLNQFQGNNLLIYKGSQIYLDPESFIKSLNLEFKTISIEDLKQILPCSREEVFNFFSDINPSYIEKILLEGILKREIFYNEGRVFLKNDK